MSDFRVGSWVLGVLVLCASCAGDRPRVPELSESESESEPEAARIEELLGDERNVSEFDGIERDGMVLKSTAENGAAENDTAQSGAAQSGAAQSGTGQNSTADESSEDASGSTTSEPTGERSTIFGPEYWARHVDKIGEDLHQFRVDIDRTIFDLDDPPEGTQSPGDGTGMDLGPSEPFSRRPEYPFDTEWSLFAIDADGQFRVRSD